MRNSSVCPIIPCLYHEYMPNRSQLLTFDYYVPFIFNAIRIGFILLFAYIATAIANRLIRALYSYSLKMMLRAGGGSDFELEKRARTITGVMRKAFVTVIWLIALIMVLKEMNFDIRPLLAGAGVIGVALGFGAQSIVKDLISGLFLLMENQIRVNDVAVINGKGGLVEEINLRTTVLRGDDGVVHIFQNGNIQSLSNMTREYSYYVFSLSVAYKEDTDRVIDVLRQLADELMQEEPYKTAILAPLDVMGVDQLADSGVVIKARCKTQPSKQWMVGREMNRRIKKRFQEAQIEIPFPTQTIQLAGSLLAEWKDSLRQVVREVLEEGKPQ